MHDKPHLNKLFKPLIIFLCVAFAGLFVYFSLAYANKLLADDLWFEHVADNNIFTDAAQSFYRNVNGRLASHYFTCAVFGIISHKPTLYVGFNVLMLIGFMASLRFLLKNYLQRFYPKSALRHKLTVLAIVMTAFYYYSFFEGRIETWYWVSSVTVYIASLIIAMFAFGFLLGHYPKKIQCTIPPLLFFMAGGFSETNAVLYALIMLFFLFYNKQLLSKVAVPYYLSMLGIAGGLFINLVSGGLQSRLGWLPEHDFLYAFKNALHSMVVPFLRLKHLPFKIVFIALLLMYVKHYYERISVNIKSAKPKLAGFVIICFVILYITCYLLSDIAPDRAMSVLYWLFVFLLFDVFVFSEKNNIIHAGKNG